MSDENRKLAARLADAEKIISLMQAHISGIEKHRVALIEDRDDLVSRAHRAEYRAYTLAVAIMGGEDAPGYADSIAAEDLASQLKKERMEQSAWVDACVSVQRDRANRAVNALSSVMQIVIDYVDPITAQDIQEELRKLAEGGSPEAQP